MKLGLKGKLVMLFSFNYEMLLSGMVHLIGGGVYLDCVVTCALWMRPWRNIMWINMEIKILLLMCFMKLIMKYMPRLCLYDLYDYVKYVKVCDLIN